MRSTLGPLWGDFGVTFAYEGDFEAILGPLWAYFLHWRVTLVAPWRHFGVNVGIRGSLWGHSGVTLAPLWGHFGCMVVTLVHFGITM